jgi:hypothetical protein
MAFEHRNYLPSIGLMLAVGNIANKLLSRPFIFVLLTSLILYFTLLTAYRAELYGKPMKRSLIEVGYHPDSPRSNQEVGWHWAQVAAKSPSNKTAIAFAQYHFTAASNLSPSFKLGIVGLLYMDCLTKRVLEQDNISNLNQRISGFPLQPADIGLISDIPSWNRSGQLCFTGDDLLDIALAIHNNDHISTQLKFDLMGIYLNQLQTMEPTLALSLADHMTSLIPSNEQIWFTSAYLKYKTGDFVSAKESIMKSEQIRQFKGQAILKKDIEAALSTAPSQH